MKFYIGQEVVCINAKGAETIFGIHSGLKQGTIYKIVGLAMSCCNVIVVDVGIKAPTNHYMCTICNRYDIPNETTGWGFSENRFAPIEYNQEAIEELLKIKEPQLK